MRGDTCIYRVLSIPHVERRTRPPDKQYKDNIPQPKKGTDGASPQALSSSKPAKKGTAVTGGAPPKPRGVPKAGAGAAAEGAEEAAVGAAVGSAMKGTAVTTGGAPPKPGLCYSDCWIVLRTDALMRVRDLLGTNSPTSIMYVAPKPRGVPKARAGAAAVGAEEAAVGAPSVPGATVERPPPTEEEEQLLNLLQRARHYHESPTIFLSKNPPGDLPTWVEPSFDQELLALRAPFHTAYDETDELEDVMRGLGDTPAPADGEERLKAVKARLEQARIAMLSGEAELELKKAKMREMVTEINDLYPLNRAKRAAAVLEELKLQAPPAARPWAELSAEAAETAAAEEAAADEEPLGDAGMHGLLIRHQAYAADDTACTKGPAPRRPLPPPKMPFVVPMALKMARSEAMKAVRELRRVAGPAFTETPQFIAADANNKAAGDAIDAAQAAHEQQYREANKLFLDVIALADSNRLKRRAALKWQSRTTQPPRAPPQRRQQQQQQREKQAPELQQQGQTPEKPKKRKGEQPQSPEVGGEAEVSESEGGEPPQYGAPWERDYVLYVAEASSRGLGQGLGRAFAESLWKNYDSEANAKKQRVDASLRDIMEDNSVSGWGGWGAAKCMYACTLDTFDMHDMLDTLDTLDTLYTLYIIYTLDTLDTLDTLRMLTPPYIPHQHMREELYAHKEWPVDDYTHEWEGKKFDLTSESCE